MENGSKVNAKDLAKHCFLMEIFMKDNGVMIKLMIMESIYGLIINAHIKDNGFIFNIIFN